MVSDRKEQRKMIEGTRRNYLRVIILFVDFKNAFDSMYRGKMLKILRAYGISQVLVNAISLLYTDTKAKVLTPDDGTEIFSILVGILPGDTLPPYIFAILIDYVMRQAVCNKAEELGFTLTPLYQYPGQISPSGNPGEKKAQKLAKFKPR